MRISVPRSVLFDQLPLDVRRELVGNPAIPRVFHFDVDDYIVDRTSRHGPLANKYPEIHASFTPMEWYIFCLLETHPEGCSIQTLAEKSRGKGTESNLVNAHVKNMRKKMWLYGFPFEIQTIRGSVLGPGAFEMIKK